MVVNFPAGPFGEYCGKNLFMSLGLFFLWRLCVMIWIHLTMWKAGSCELNFNGFLIYFLAQDFVIDEALDMDLERYLGDGKM